MDNRLENLRMYFPAEVTASFLAIQRLLAANSIGQGEDMWYVAGVIGVLVVINVAIYLRFYGIASVFFHIILAAGFIIWAINIDMPRFRDFPYLGEHIEIAAPTLLIFYTLLTSFFQLPKGKSDALAP